MAVRILGQVAPGTSCVNLCQAVSGKSIVVSCLICLNTHLSNNDQVIIYLDKNNVGPTMVGNSEAVFKADIAPGESFVVVAGISLGPLQGIHVKSTNGSVTYTACGDES